MPMVYTHGRRMALQRLGLKLAAQTMSEADATEMAGTGVAAGATGLMLSGMGMEAALDSREGMSAAQRASNEAISRKMLAEHNAKYDPLKHYSPKDVYSGRAPSSVESDAAHYDFRGPHIVADLKDPEIVAHELGHATASSNLGKFHDYGLPATTITSALGMPLGGIYGYNQDPSEHNPLAVAGVSAAMRTPQLLSEAHASLEGLRKLHPHGYDKGTAASTLLPAFGTYLGYNALGVGTDVLGYESGRAIRDWKDNG